MRGGVLFGKLPRHGDFVARGLDSAARQAWDDWASTGLLRARAAMADSFEDAHDAAPPWRFIGRPQGFGEAWMVGALAPSMDAAGRRFVIMLGVQGLSQDEAADLGPDLSARLEDIVYRCFSEALDADAAVAAADQALHEPHSAGPAAVDALARGGVWWISGAEHEPSAVIASSTPPPDLFERGMALGQALA